MPSISEDTLTDVQMESSPELQTDASASESNSSERSSVYEADLSSHVASVAWPRRPEGRPPSVSYLFRDSHGRTLNTKNECYVLPADELEHQRLDIQNLMVQYYLGAPYPAKDIVEEILKPREGYIPMILDVGTGSGAWYDHCPCLSAVIDAHYFEHTLEGRWT
ncbi:hypothetical protein FRC03_011666 [Tulasnella sp. 419]|nr:hypothetical protein FRC03_011666 [Tulasnella sp. 419]